MRRFGERVRSTSQVSDWITGDSWTPYALRNLIAWWDASISSTFTFSSGTSVSQWNSLVGGHSFVQATAAKQPSRSGTLNGLSTVVFDGSNDSMATSATVDMTGSQTFSLWAVFTSASGGDQSVLEQTTNFNNVAGAFVLSRTSANRVGFAKRGFNLYTAVDSGDTLTTTPKAVIARHDGTLTSVECQLFVNADIRQLLVVNDNTNSNNLNDTLFLAARNNASAFLNGTIAELGVSTSVFTLQEAILLNDYLRAKWAI